MEVKAAMRTQPHINFLLCHTLGRYAIALLFYSEFLGIYFLIFSVSNTFPSDPIDNSSLWFSIISKSEKGS